MAQILSPTPCTPPRNNSDLLRTPIPFHLTSFLTYQFPSVIEVSMSCLSHSSERLRQGLSPQHRDGHGVSAHNHWVSPRADPRRRKLNGPEKKAA